MDDNVVGQRSLPAQGSQATCDIWCISDLVPIADKPETVHVHLAVYGIQQNATTLPEASEALGVCKPPVRPGLTRLDELHAFL